MFNDAELSLIKNTFGGEEGEDRLYLVRNVLLQFPLSADEKKRIKGFMTSAVYDVLKKRVVPEVGPDLPLGQLADLQQTLTNDLKTKDVDEMAPLFVAKQLEIDYLKQQFEQLMDVEREFTSKIILNNLAQITGPMSDCGNWFVNTTARNFILGYVDSMLIMFKNIAEVKNETPEEMKKRLTRDSSK